MIQNLDNLLRNAAEKPPRSKLEPYREFIRELRVKRWSYREIAAMFEQQLRLEVAPSTLHNFVKVRAKQRSVLAMVPVAPVSIGETSREIDRQAVRKLPERQRFEFAPGEALRLTKQGKETK